MQGYWAFGQLARRAPALCACVLVFYIFPLSSTLCSDARSTVFNGNGKLPWELELAAEKGVLINIDSEFDLHVSIVTIEWQRAQWA